MIHDSLVFVFDSKTSFYNLTRLNGNSQCFDEKIRFFYAKSRRFGPDKPYFCESIFSKVMSGNFCTKVTSASSLSEACFCSVSVTR